MSTQYNVWITEKDGTRYMLSLRNRTAWSLRTAIKYAEEFIDIHGAWITSVVPEKNEVNNA